MCVCVWMIIQKICFEIAALGYLNQDIEHKFTSRDVRLVQGIVDSFFKNGSALG